MFPEKVSTRLNRHDVAGYLYPLAARMNRYNIIKAIWFAACLTVLWFTYDAREINDVYIVFIYFTLALTFPIGVLVQGIVFFSGSIFGLIWPDGFLGYLSFWVIAVGLGYWQWFVAVPWLFKRMKAVWK